MKHGRPDYDRIQDPAGLIPPDEPVFLCRGQDDFAHYVVEFWCFLAEKFGVERNMIANAKGQAQRMAEWPLKKLPDLPPPNDDPEAA